MSHTIQNSVINLGQTITAKAKAVMSDGTFQEFVAGSTFAWIVTDPTTIQVLTPLANPCQFLGIKGSSVVEVSVIVTTPDGNRHSPQVQLTPVTDPTHAQILVLPLPIVPVTIVDVVILFQ